MITPTTQDLVARYYSCGYGYSYNGYSCDRQSSWYYWGRWAVIGAVAFVVIMLLLCCACVARRRKRKGTKPVYGTGWLAGGKFGGNNNNNGVPMNNYQQSYPQYGQQGYQQGYGQQQNYGVSNAPPAYGNQQQPQYTGTTFNQGDGYYGQQQYGNVQQPANTYSRDAAYSSPDVPPPGK